MTSIELIIDPRISKISDVFTVRRVLPFRLKRLVGPFCFLDHMGPIALNPSVNSDVLPHPHIGLSTLTYLFSGQIFHRDSLNTEQVIKPGDVNWMTAGSGIVHSERILKEWMAGSILHGLQAWVALPKEYEDCEPSFEHYSKSDLPEFSVNFVLINLVAGKLFNKKSPVKTYSNLIYAKLTFIEQSNFEYNFTDQNFEVAIYLIEGVATIDDKTIEAGQMVIFKKSSILKINAKQNTICVLIGGEPLPEERFIYWNFVSTSKDKIELAKQKWVDQKFPKIKDETEFTPLPQK